MELGNFARLTHHYKAEYRRCDARARAEVESLGEFSHDWEKLALKVTST